MTITDLPPACHLHSIHYPCKNAHLLTLSYIRFHHNKKGQYTD